MGNREAEKEYKKPKATVSEVLENVKEIICDNYCKYREAYEDTEQMIDERCANCVLNFL